VDGITAGGGELAANSGDLAASQPNPVWVKFDSEADAAYIGLAFIGPGKRCGK
jgi:hypothetical protein